VTLFEIILLILVTGILGILLLPLRYRVQWNHVEAGAPHKYQVFAGITGAAGVQFTDERPPALVFLGYRRGFEPEKKEKPEAKEEMEAEAGLPGAKTRQAVRRVSQVRRYFSVGDLITLAGRTLRVIGSWIRPELSSVNLRYGAGNPMHTGMIHGILWASGLPRVLEGAVVPDFTMQDVIGSAELRGGGRVGTLLGGLLGIIMLALSIVIRRKIRIILVAFQQRLAHSRASRTSRS